MNYKRTNLGISEPVIERHVLSIRIHPLLGRVLGVIRVVLGTSGLVMPIASAVVRVCLVIAIARVRRNVNAVLVVLPSAGARVRLARSPCHKAQEYHQLESHRSSDSWQKHNRLFETTGYTHRRRRTGVAAIDGCLVALDTWSLRWRFNITR